MALFEREPVMMKKVILIISITFIVGVLIIGLAIHAYLSKSDTKLAQKFSQVMNSYDITQIDNYFSNDTLFICNGKSDTYANLKNNIATACKNKKFVFYDSYGHGTDRFVNNLQNISVIVYGAYNNNDIGEGSIELTLRKSGLSRITIESVKCNDSFFEAIFFGY